jgi:hypothetical protein
MDTSSILCGIVGAGIAALLVRLTAIERRVRRLSLESKLDAFMAAEGITFDPFGKLASTVREALQRGETIEPIKQVRQATGISLKDAKVTYPTPPAWPGNRSGASNVIAGARENGRTLSASRMVQPSLEANSVVAYVDLLERQEMFSRAAGAASTGYCGCCVPLFPFCR